MNLAYVIIAAVLLQRIAELLYGERNTRALLARGAVEVGRGHYPLMVLLHASWLSAIALALPREPTTHWFPLALYAVLQIGRVWVIASLGPYWTTRIVTLPDAPLVRTGPYRYFRHPNYLIVIGEIALLPLAFDEWRLAAIFSALNLALLAWRVREEEAALSARR